MKNSEKLQEFWSEKISLGDEISIVLDNLTLTDALGRISLTQRFPPVVFAGDTLNVTWRLEFEK